MFCTSCGTRAVGEFCGKCGAAIQQPDPSTPQPATAWETPATAGPIPSAVASSPVASDQPGAILNPFFWIWRCLRKYASFKGRARRREYGYFSIFAFLYSCAAYLAAYTAASWAHDADADVIDGMASLLLLPIILPSLCLQVRRLHDLGLSGWLVLFFLIPFAGAVQAPILLFKNGTPGANKYGPSPKLSGEEHNQGAVFAIGLLPLSVVIVAVAAISSLSKAH